MSGEDDGDTIRSAAPVEVIFGGEKRAEDLEALSVVTGNRDTWHHARDAGGGRSKQRDTERLMPPEALHNLPARKAVILAPACRPVLADTPAIWERRGHVPRGPRRVHAPRAGAAGTRSCPGSRRSRCRVPPPVSPVTCAARRSPRLPGMPALTRDEALS